MRLNSIGVILLLSFYLIVPTNGILHLILQGLSHSLNLNHGVSPNQLVQQMLNSPDILNGVAKNFDVGHLANVLQQQGDKWGINTDPRDLLQIIAAEKAKFEHRFPGFDFKQFLTGNTTDMTSYFNNENPDKIDAHLYSKELKEWTFAEVYPWAKDTLPMDCLPTFENLKLNGRQLLEKVDKAFIKKHFKKIEDEDIQDIILEEIKILEDTVNSHLKFKAETEEKTKNAKNNGEMNEDELHTIKQTFINLKDHTDHTMITIQENVHKMQKLFSSKFLYHHTLKQMQEMSLIVQRTAYHIDILETALDKSLEEKFQNFKEKKALQEELTALKDENEKLQTANSEKEQLLQENSEEIQMWKEKLTTLTEEKDNAFKELKKSTDSEIEIWQEKLTTLTEEKNTELEELKKSTDFEKEQLRSEKEQLIQETKLAIENEKKYIDKAVKKIQRQNDQRADQQKKFFDEERLKRENLEKQLEEQREDSRISQQWLNDKLAERVFQNKEKTIEISSNRLEIEALRNKNTNLQQDLKKQQEDSRMSQQWLNDKLAAKDDEIKKLHERLAASEIDKSSPKNESYDDVFDTDESPKSKKSWLPTFSRGNKNTKK